MCLRTFPLIHGHANVFRGPPKRSGSQEFGEVCTDKKESLRVRHSKTSRHVNPPGCDFASRGLPCPRSLLVSRILTKLSIDKVPGDLSFLDDQTAPKSYCLKMTEARSQNGYHRDASSNNPQSKEGDRRGDRAETQHPIGSRESWASQQTAGLQMCLNCLLPRHILFFNTWCSKGHVCLQPREKAFASLCTRHD